MNHIPQYGSIIFYLSTHCSMFSVIFQIKDKNISSCLEIFWQVRSEMRESQAQGNPGGCHFNGIERGARREIEERDGEVFIIRGPLQPSGTALIKKEENKCIIDKCKVLRESSTGNGSRGRVETGLRTEIDTGSYSFFPAAAGSFIHFSCPHPAF